MSGGGLLTRRRALALTAAALAPQAGLGAPLSPRPQRRPSLGPNGAALAGALAPSGVVAFCVIDMGSGDVLDALNPAAPVAPASVAKVATAMFALETLGPAHRFVTTLRRAGGAAPGVTLTGGGDPALDSDALAAMAAQAAAGGLTAAPGGVRADAGLVTPLIDADQPERAAYNPAVAALNLNFNRVRLRWTRRGRSLEAQLEAQAAAWSPPAEAIALTLAGADCGCAPLAYTPAAQREGWTVRADLLRRDGGVWLPVRDPARYAAGVMAAALRARSVTVGAGPAGDAEGSPLARHDSAPLAEIAARMLRYSTNLTAEALGLAAAPPPPGPPGPARLAASAAALNGWAARRAGTDGFAFTNYSGLSADSAASCAGLARLMAALRRAPGPTPVETLLRAHRIDDRDSPAPDGALVLAKTGTLDFARGLAGYADTASGRRLAFAYIANDLPRRAATRGGDGSPPGARAWRNRAVRLERALLRHWLTRLG